jgi:hypothetical protein
MANPAPLAYAISPAIVPAAGGRIVQIVGANIDPASVSLTVAGSAVATTTMDSRFLGQFPAPAHAAGKGNVVITTTDGTATLTNAITYV